MFDKWPQIGQWDCYVEKCGIGSAKATPRKSW